MDCSIISDHLDGILADAERSPDSWVPAHNIGPWMFFENSHDEFMETEQQSWPNWIKIDPVSGKIQADRDIFNKITERESEGPFQIVPCNAYRATSKNGEEELSLRLASMQCFDFPMYCSPIVLLLTMAKWDPITTAFTSWKTLSIIHRVLLNQDADINSRKRIKIINAYEYILSSNEIVHKNYMKSNVLKNCCDDTLEKACLQFKTIASMRYMLAIIHFLEYSILSLCNIPVRKMVGAFSNGKIPFQRIVSQTVQTLCNDNNSFMMSVRFLDMHECEQGLIQAHHKKYPNLGKDIEHWSNYDNLKNGVPDSALQTFFMCLELIYESEKTHVYTGEEDSLLSSEKMEIDHEIDPME